MSKQRIAMQFMLAPLFSFSPTWAQTFRDRTTGILTDESKAEVAGTNVTLTNVGFACPATLGSVHEEKL